MSKDIVIGIGNILFSDDGIGVFTAKVLKEHYSFSNDLEIVDGGTLGIGLVNYFSEYDNVLILDTISLDDEVGSIYSFPSRELLNLEGFKNTAHEVEVVDMLRSTSLLENCARVQICAIVPEDIVSVSIGLSDEIEKYFDSYLETVIEEIKNMGIDVVKKDDYSLEKIADGFTKWK
ncbi:MAG: HyaD/HybD family hydrogenase maturation endopeptidase [Campylobacterota bacterium]|nr:HyaD/HybD family hydrogenase maturation endopeptidase [Campylobacterota bacterium]